MEIPFVTLTVHSHTFPGISRSKSTSAWGKPLNIVLLSPTRYLHSWEWIFVKNTGSLLTHQINGCFSNDETDDGNPTSGKFPRLVNCALFTPFVLTSVPPRWRHPWLMGSSSNQLRNSPTSAASRIIADRCVTASPMNSHCVATHHRFVSVSTILSNRLNNSHMTKSDAYLTQEF